MRFMSFNVTSRAVFGKLSKSPAQECGWLIGERKQWGVWFYAALQTSHLPANVSDFM